MVVNRKERAREFACLHLVLYINILFLSDSSEMRSETLSCLFLRVHPWNSPSLWTIGEPHKSRLHRQRQNGGDVGLAQPSMDYDVDSNPEGWTQRLRVKGLYGLWATARWMHYRQPWVWCSLASIWQIGDVHFTNVNRSLFHYHQLNSWTLIKSIKCWKYVKVQAYGSSVNKFLLWS